jgi:molybdopterin-binding protein
VIALRDGKVVVTGPVMRAAAGDAFQSLLGSRDVGAPIMIDSRTAWARADHVLLATVRPNGLSARHIWPARIESMLPERNSSYLVVLGATGGALRARVTQAAAAELGLRVGGDVWAIVKAHSL